MDHLSFREELHAIEAVIAGQGIGIFSKVLVAHELAVGTLVKAFDVSLPGYRFYVVRTPGHPREKSIQALSTWLQSVLQIPLLYTLPRLRGHAMLAARIRRRAATAALRSIAPGAP
jgi:hypothetical protein